MEGYQPDIQALLQDINGDYRIPKRKFLLQPPSRPAAKPVLESNKSQTERSMVPRNASAKHEVQASRPLDAYLYSSLNDTDLDSHGTHLKVSMNQISHS